MHQTTYAFLTKVQQPFQTRIDLFHTLAKMGLMF